MKSIYAVCAMASTLATPHLAEAQRSSDTLAQEWRDAKRRELLDQRAGVDKQLASLDGATPNLIAIPVTATVAAVVPALAVYRPIQSPATLAVVVPAVPPIPAPAGGVGPSPPPALPAVGAVGVAGAVVPPAPAVPALLAIIPPSAPRGTFGGIDFGIGISFTLDVGTSDRISDASLVNGIVRVNDEDNGRARIMLESHYLFTPPSNVDFLGLDNSGTEKEWGFGPFIALQPGTEDVIEAIGMGLMFGFRRGKGDESFNLGFGVVIDPNTRILGEGVAANQPLTNGETEVRYREELQTGLLILSSFSF
ncbi:hypothetical protein [Sphingomonas sp. Leaf208]|uniref:hypothetical protein n=1 Tax=Sphingomonas sp. Leaf208 TaxID=1735679 RepID=UPI000AC854C4|nr:hypothetical protein [Sphingomonas sp. Leaf208]